MQHNSTGISRVVIEEISAAKNEPGWMRRKRLEAFDIFEKTPLPAVGPVNQLKDLDFKKIHYYIKPQGHLARTWDDVPEEIRKKYDALGIPEGEREYLAGLGAQYESEMIYHSLRQELIDKGIVFEDMSVAVTKYPDLIQEYFGSVIAVDNNKFAALNGAVWSGGSLVHIPPGVYLEAPLHNFFQMSTPSQGQFE